MMMEAIRSSETPVPTRAYGATSQHGILQR
jgi:hypothetical protein